MIRSSIRTALLVLVASTLALAGPIARAGGDAQRPVPTTPSPTVGNDRFIVKLRDAKAEPRSGLSALGGRNGARLEYIRAMSGGAHVVRVTQGLQELVSSTGSASKARRLLAKQLMSDPAVQYAEPDLKLYPMLTPNDSMYSSQWDLYEAAGGINAPAAWDITTGSNSIVVAVIDTGYRPHADLAARITGGYDFIADPSVSNDGDGRDADASDPGDYGCNGSSSSWHGTHVSGTIGAVSNNGSGIAGINWVSKILPARVLGVCGGYTSDIVDAMRWSAGLAVNGVPTNPNPARVENLSLGGDGTCEISFQSAINDVVAQGTVVVVAAGNSSADAANTQPASCNNVITVGATTRTGGRAGYSNFGSKLTISAPGSGILSTLNAGTTTPSGDSYAVYSGTSMATPHVVGVVSLMLSQNPSLTPAQVKSILVSSARPFPTGTGSDCTTAQCGAGIVDAGAAVAASKPSTLTNVALASLGTVASASSTYSSGYPPSGANDGDRKGANFGNGGYWNDATPSSFPDWLQLTFPSAATISEVDVFSIQDNYSNPQDPTSTMTFSQYGLVDFDVQYWDGSNWVTVAAITGNNLVWRKVTFAAVATTAVRIYVRKATDLWSRVAEVEVYGTLGAVTPPPTPSPTSANLALASAGTVASASSTYNSGYAPASVNNGDRKGVNPGNGGYWNDASSNAFPDWVQLTFNGTTTISEVDVFSIQDNYTNPQDPTSTMTFSLYGLVDFDVQYWDGANWVTVPNGGITGNNLVWRKVTFSPIATTAIRVYVRRAQDQWSRIAEIEAYGDSTTPTPTPVAVNVASLANGGSASASSTYSNGYAPSGAIDGDRRGLNPGSGGYWNDASPNSFPDTFQVNFSGTKSINEVDVFGIQDNYDSPSEPTTTMTFSKYGLIDFDVQYWNGSSWVTLPNGSIRGNNLIWRKITFATVSTNAIRIVVITTPDMWSRIAEVEAYQAQ